MARLALFPTVLLLGVAASGCLGGSGDPEQAQSEALPPGWDEASPDASQLAESAYYVLDQSTSFILKGHSYGRFIVQIPERIEGAQMLFTTGQPTDGYTPEADAPALRGPDPLAPEYHFEFLQVRPLGQQLEQASVDAGAEFGYAFAPGAYTLTYIYGKGTNHPFLAPYQGNPLDWTFESGFYEIVLATDEMITVGVSIHTKNDYWTTRYHPQELGTARAESLKYRADVYETVGGKLPDLRLEDSDLLRAREGENLNYFAFADAWYETHGFAIDAHGLATVTVNGADTHHRLAVSKSGPAKEEAFAFAMRFNAPGPLRERVGVQSLFAESLSAQSTVGVLTLIFAVATKPTATHPDIPAPS